MKIYVILAVLVIVAAAANILFYLWFAKKMFGKASFEEIPEEGHFVFRIAEKNFQYSIPLAEYEKSKSEPVPVPGTDRIYLYRGRIYEELESAAEEMSKRAGQEAARAFLTRMTGSPKKITGKKP